MSNNSVKSGNAYDLGDINEGVTSGAKKAAVLLMTLGTELSSEILKNLSDKQVQKIGVEIANLHKVTAEERRKILREFLEARKSKDFAMQGGIDYAKSHRQEDNLGNNIDKYIMGMQYAQTNGIPQGGVLFDFIAEMVLGYSDLLLYEELQRMGITHYKILRYRDDYRIFSNSKEELEKIAMTLQITLAKLNFQLNSSKTKLCEDIIESSVKADKLFYIANLPIYKGEETVFNTLQQELLYILCLSKQYPNSGTISKLLTIFLKRISAIDNLSENVGVLSAIVVEIAMNSPKVYSLTVSIISNLINHLDTTDKRETMAKNICNKFSRLPNIGYLQLWMQRITFQMNTSMGYTEPLCEIVENKPNVQIWNNEWLKDEYTAEFPLYSMCTNWLRDTFTPIINIDEVSIFDY